MTQVATISELYDLVECPQCDDYYVPGEEVAMTVEQARFKLYRYCKGAGWSETRTRKFMDKHLPLSDQRVST